jgi:hypothetical protein
VTRGFVILVLGAALVGCGGSSLFVPRGDGSSQTPPDPFATEPTILPRPIQAAPYLDVPKVAGDCSARGGTPQVPASPSEVASLLVGRWRYCSGSTSGIAIVSEGMELARNRRFRILFSKDGALVPASNVEPGYWYLAAEDPTIPNDNGLGLTALLLFRPGVPATADMFYHLASFLQNPTRIQIFDATYVWQGE